MSQPRDVGVEALESSAGSIAPGTLLGNATYRTYRIDGHLGGGRTGEVYRGTNTVTGAPCPIKTIRPEFLQDQFLRSLFVREALKSVRDNAVVDYEGVSVTREGPCSSSWMSCTGRRWPNTCASGR